MVHIAFMADYEQVMYETCHTLDHVSAENREKALSLLPKDLRMIESLLIFHQDGKIESFAARNVFFCECFPSSRCKCNIEEILKQYE